MSQVLRQHIEEIISLSDDEFEYVLSHFKTKKLRKHQFVVQEGQRIENDFFIVSGCLKSFHTDNDGKLHIIQFGMQGWWITDYEAYYSQSVAILTYHKPYKNNSVMEEMLIGLKKPKVYFFLKLINVP